MQELWDHQKKCVEIAKDLPNYALFFEVGTGKTRATVELLRYKFNTQKKILRTLIFCPIIVCKNWRDEWLKYSKIDKENVIVLSGSGREREAKFVDSAYEFEKPAGRIFICNYESLLMPELFKLFEYWRPEAIVFDESHRLKSFNSQRSKKAYELANPRVPPTPYKYLLTGTPILNSPLDIFQPFKIMDGGRTFGDNFFAFRGRYFHDKNATWKSKSQKYFPKWEVLPNAIDEINNLIKTSSMHVKKSECLDLPPLVRQIITVKMLPAQEKVYKELSKHFVTFIRDKSVSATLAIVKALRLMQITSGFVTLDNQGEEEAVQETFDDAPKIAALKELLEDLTPHSKVLVWAVWKENYKQIRALCLSLGIEMVEVHGEISEAKKQEAVEKFNTDTSTRVLLGHPGSGGIGINLIVAPVCIFYSRTFSLEHSLQAEARNYRGGSEIHDKITRIDLVVENTIDHEVVKRLHQKEQIGLELLKTIAKECL